MVWNVPVHVVSVEETNCENSPQRIEDEEMESRDEDYDEL